MLRPMVAFNLPSFNNNTEGEGEGEGKKKERGSMHFANLPPFLPPMLCGGEGGGGGGGGGRRFVVDRSDVRRRPTSRDSFFFVLIGGLYPIISLTALGLGKKIPGLGRCVTPRGALRQPQRDVGMHEDNLRNRRFLPPPPCPGCYVRGRNGRGEGEKGNLAKDKFTFFFF